METDQKKTEHSYQWFGSNNETNEKKNEPNFYQAKSNRIMIGFLSQEMRSVFSHLCILDVMMLVDNSHPMFALMLNKKYRWRKKNMAMCCTQCSSRQFFRKYSHTIQKASLLRCYFHSLSIFSTQFSICAIARFYSLFISFSHLICRERQKFFLTMQGIF